MRVCVYVCFLTYSVDKCVCVGLCVYNMNPLYMYIIIYVYFIYMGIAGMILQVHISLSRHTRRACSCFTTKISHTVTGLLPTCRRYINITIIVYYNNIALFVYMCRHTIYNILHRVYIYHTWKMIGTAVRYN